MTEDLGEKVWQEFDSYVDWSCVEMRLREVLKILNLHVRTTGNSFECFEVLDGCATRNGLNFFQGDLTLVLEEDVSKAVLMCMPEYIKQVLNPHSRLSGEYEIDRILCWRESNYARWDFLEHVEPGLARLLYLFIAVRTIEITTASVNMCLRVEVKLQ
jgi:hypothetical protein